MSDEQQPSPQPGWQPPATGYYMPPPTHSRATTALVLGILGIVMCPGVLSIPAWVVGRSAMREIDASQGALGGRSNAQAGFILGIVGTALAALSLLVVVVVFAWGALIAGSFGNCSTVATDNTVSVDC